MLLLLTSSLFIPLSIGCGDTSKAIRCGDGTCEEGGEWGPDVVGCRGPDQYWSVYWDDTDLYCALGWDMADAWIVNAYLVDDGYDSSP
jgi:hypothetical protein